MIVDNRCIAQFSDYGAPDQIFTKDHMKVSMEDSIGCDIVTYWKKYKAADDKAKVIVDVFFTTDNKAPKCSVEFNASDFFVSDLEEFCKKIMGPAKRQLCEEITEVTGVHKIMNYTVAISQKLPSKQILN